MFTHCKNGHERTESNTYIYNGHARCRECRRKTNLRWLYNLTLEDYESLLSAQSGKCWICKDIEYPLKVDHNHVTGKVRGLLCRRCNILVGLYEQLPNFDLQMVDDYLSR